MHPARPVQQAEPILVSYANAPSDTMPTTSNANIAMPATAKKPLVSGPPAIPTTRKAEIAVTMVMRPHIGQEAPTIATSAMIATITIRINIGIMCFLSISFLLAVLHSMTASGTFSALAVVMRWPKCPCLPLDVGDNERARRCRWIGLT